MQLIKFVFAPNSLCFFSCPAAKADKRAAQVKIQQQENKRQVCVCPFSCASPDGGAVALYLPS